MEPDERLIGGAVGAVLALAIAMVMVPLRDDVSSAVVALLLVVPVVVGAVVGGIASGATTAVVSTLCFDFFFTAPFGSLHMSSADDVESACVLFLVALLVGATSARARRSHRRADLRQDELTAVYRVASSIVEHAPLEEVVRSASVELRMLLDLERCEYLVGEGSSALPEISSSGRVAVQYHRFLDGGFQLPPGSQLPARGPAGVHGRFLLYAKDDVAVSIERKRAAIVIADLVGSAIEARREG